MKKKNIINLIKYHIEKNDNAFRDEAYEIAMDFNRSDDYQLGSYILSLLSNRNTFTPQELNNKSDFFHQLDCNNSLLAIPSVIEEDLKGIINAASYNAGVNKFLFEGPPGTGKTESAKQLARILNRQLYMVDFESIIDSKMGSTAKNLSEVFNEINALNNPEETIFLFDEIDALALDRTNSRDLREMGRATSAFLKGLDNLNPNTIIIATTNLFKNFDKALIRRFDKIVDYSRYDKEDLLEISEKILLDQLKIFSIKEVNMRMFHKILNLMDIVYYPGEMKNLIRSAIAFSNPNTKLDYLKKFFYSAIPNCNNDIQTLINLGFTLREIEIITNVSKSTISRGLNKQ